MHGIMIEEDLIAIVAALVMIPYFINTDDRLLLLSMLQMHWHVKACRDREQLGDGIINSITIAAND